MRMVIQRVLEASVSVDDIATGCILQGLLVLVGFKETDDDKTIEYMVEKMLNLRIFEDSNGKMNLSLFDVKKKVLMVPNFTLYGDARKGRRPSFDSGAAPKDAGVIFEKLKLFLLERYPGKVEFGIFQAEMKVSLINDGPVTILLDSEKQF